MYIITSICIARFGDTKEGKSLSLRGIEDFNKSRKEHGLPALTQEDWVKNMDRLSVVRTRLIGFFRTKKKAERVIEYNIGDISELNYYNAAVIEKVKFGNLPIPSSEEWYLFETHKIQEEGKETQYKYEYHKLDKTPFPGTTCWYS